MNRANNIILRTRTGEETHVLREPHHPICPLGWFRDGSVLVVGGDSQGKAAALKYSFDPPQATPLHANVGGTNRGQWISPDGKTVYRAENATGGRINAVDVFSGTTRSVIAVPWIRSLALSRDGRQLAYVEGDSKAAGKPDILYAIDVDGGQPRKVAEFVRPLVAIGGLQWAPDGRHLLVVVSGRVDWVSVTDGTVQATGALQCRRHRLFPPTVGPLHSPSAATRPRPGFWRISFPQVRHAGRTAPVRGTLTEFNSVLEFDQRPSNFLLPRRSTLGYGIVFNANLAIKPTR